MEKESIPQGNILLLTSEGGASSTNRQGVFSLSAQLESPPHPAPALIGRPWSTEPLSCQQLGGVWKVSLPTYGSILWGHVPKPYQEWDHHLGNLK